ncbi:uncharacterized protein N7477_007339 [Penicillium maclennaniae]|uniref:uncharacterized protein n=1 Tax=Penicillium maclennaniae TaxID=1343394 RepID=UPI0025402894|nr:uncharacterized protein N7477_007339 [Penicillium maclennaniae]KAJ5664891.1 hypothetical protein N7477_007339 [Penicillium maclennaniae]
MGSTGMIMIANTRRLVDDGGKFVTPKGHDKGLLKRICQKALNRGGRVRVDGNGCKRVTAQYLRNNDKV